MASIWLFGLSEYALGERPSQETATSRDSQRRWWRQGLGGAETRERGLATACCHYAPSRFKARASTRSSRQQPRSPTESPYPTHHQSLNLERKKEKKVKSLSRVRLFVTPWTVAYQAPPSMGFSRQEYWSGLPFPSPGDLPDPGIEHRSPAL